MSGVIVKLLATGSTGNCTAFFVGDYILLIDCGISFQKIISKLGGRLPDAVLITHEHGDHSKFVRQFVNRGVQIFASTGTFDALNLPERYNLHTITPHISFHTCGVNVTPIHSKHDAIAPLNFILQDDADRVLFVTDTGEIPDVDGSFSKILIEANYSESEILSANIDEYQRQRILHNHLSIEQVKTFLQNHYDAEVTLIHVSKRHGGNIKLHRCGRRKFVSPSPPPKRFL